MISLLKTVLFLLGLISVEGIRNTITFTNDYVFEDISTYNFAAGINETLEFLVTARPGRQVSFYFCTSMRNSVVITVFDGNTTNATTVDIREIKYADSLYANSSIEAPYVNSTNGTLLIQIQAYVGPLPNKVIDFQGMVTDFENSGDCGSLLLSNNAASKWFPTIASSNGTRCIKVLRSTDHTYNPMLATYLSLGSTEDVIVYKGLFMNDQHALISYTSPPDLFVADKYIILDISSQKNVTLNYQWKTIGGSTAMTLQPGDNGTIMTQDYLPDHLTLSTGSYQQQFTIELMATGSDITGIKLELLAPIGSVSNVTIEYYLYNELQSAKKYTNGALPTTIEQCGKKIVVAYESIIGQGQGLYAKYSKGGLTCTNGSMSPTLITFTQVLVSLLLIMC